MIDYPDDRLYSPDHVWILPDGRAGVTPRFLETMRSVVRVHLPAAGVRVRAAEAFAAIESDKSVVEVYAPCDGVLTEVNADVAGTTLREAPFETWLAVIEGEPQGLWRASDYLERAQRQSGA